jgi:hypothetical protein
MARYPGFLERFARSEKSLSASRHRDAAIEILQRHSGLAKSEQD